jgi:hypothetical protein
MQSVAKSIYYFKLCKTFLKVCEQVEIFKLQISI